MLADRALTHIREMIATARLGPGDRVNEVEIAAQLGISRAPVREAIRRLASSGLVVSEPNLGSRVVQIDMAKIRALYEVREALESMSAGLAAQRMTDAERAALLEMLDEHAAQMHGQGSSTYPAGSSDWDFHLAVLKGSRNEVAWRICGSDLRDLLSLLRARHGRRPGRGEQALLEHRWVAEAIRAGNADFASLLMAQHIRASRDNLFAVLSPVGRPEEKEDRYDSNVA
ncbi:GntR family transcriptional regulator [Chelativorans sp. AA-79]|uniref:GntR family transcriptional regulator n=1 Tax=Chelativorans sp. AA-79 TaxID=3028735 RepID=UPI0023F74618|nr:GntR family transcriptional regulator [Chelativorans sp. AA-79]WEX10653.1 GntR family transcriptional regulator [Chelativorans sp. AA-79]